MAQQQLKLSTLSTQRKGRERCHYVTSAATPSLPQQLHCGYSCRTATVQDSAVALLPLHFPSAQGRKAEYGTAAAC